IAGVVAGRGDETRRGPRRMDEPQAEHENRRPNPHAALTESGDSLHAHHAYADTQTGVMASSIQRAIAVMRASSCCWPMRWMPTGRPPTAKRGIVTAGANSMELGALNTKSPVGRGASGWPGTSPDQRGAGPGQDSVTTASPSGATAAWRSWAVARSIRAAR